MKAKEFLLQIQKYDALIKNRVEYIYMLKERAMDISGSFYDGVNVQSSKRVDKMESAVIGYVQEEEVLQKEISLYWEKRAEIIRVIEQLNATEYDFLHKKYVANKTLQDIADDYNMSYSWSKTMHNRSLKKVQAILDNAVKVVG